MGSVHDGNPSEVQSQPAGQPGGRKGQVKGLTCNSRHSL